jgi:hypothetical protein
MSATVKKVHPIFGTLEGWEDRRFGQEVNGKWSSRAMSDCPWDGQWKSVDGIPHFASKSLGRQFTIVPKGSGYVVYEDHYPDPTPYDPETPNQPIFDGEAFPTPEAAFEALCDDYPPEG